MEKINRARSIMDCCYVISTQNFTADGRNTVYTVKDLVSGELLQKTAQEIYNDESMLEKFSTRDIRNITYSAIMESEENAFLDFLSEQENAARVDNLRPPTSHPETDSFYEEEQFETEL